MPMSSERDATLRRRRPGAACSRAWPRRSPRGVATEPPCGWSASGPGACRSPGGWPGISSGSWASLSPVGTDRHHALPRRPQPGRPLARPARDRDPLRRRRGGDRPGRRCPLHRPDGPGGPQRRLRPRPAGGGPAGGGRRPGPPRGADPGRRGRPGRRPDRAGERVLVRVNPVDAVEEVVKVAEARPCEPGDAEEHADVISDRPVGRTDGLDPQAPARARGSLGRGDRRPSSTPPSRSPRSPSGAARRSPPCRAGSSSTCSSRTRRAPARASAWPPSGSRPTRRTFPRRSRASRRARRSSTPPRTSRRWAPT